MLDGRRETNLNTAFINTYGEKHEEEKQLTAPQRKTLSTPRICAASPPRRGPASIPIAIALITRLIGPSTLSASKESWTKRIEAVWRDAEDKPCTALPTASPR